MKNQKISLHISTLKIELNKRYKIGLKGLTLWNSWYNISSEYKNNIFKLMDSKLQIQEIVFQDGKYTLKI